ncbi:DNA recombination/repair protein RecA, partial [Anaerosalibacter bizertensis]|nr:DNA recombination/repair protein RecA [Anaerosalibacter bizertensis]
GDNIIGNRTRVRVVKNKVAPPFKKAEFDIMYGEGISKEGNILDVGAASEIINKSGSWYSYGEHRLGQGRENSKDFLKENPKIALEIENKIREKYGLTNTKEKKDNVTEPEKKKNK